MDGAKCQTCESSVLKTIEVKITFCPQCEDFCIKPNCSEEFPLDTDSASTDSEDENENDEKTPSVKRNIPTPPTKR